MRNFRNAALASATALAIAATGTTAAFAGELSQGKEECSGYNREDNLPEAGGPLGVLFKGTACEEDKSVKEIISGGFQGIRDGQGSSQFLPDDRNEEASARDAFGTQTYWQLLPQWMRLLIDATAITGIGAFVGLIIAGVNFASYNGLVQLPEFPLPQF